MSMQSVSNSQSDFGKIAILDVGSNSIRLVIFKPPYIKPFVNEKDQVALGQKIAETGKLKNKTRARMAIQRFKNIVDQNNVDHFMAIGTAALRDAEDGDEFVERVRKESSVEIDVIDGAQEAKYAALSIQKHFGEAEGMVGDMGGGSLELVRIEGDQVIEPVSLFLGVLRVMAQEEPKAYIKEHLAALPDALKGAENFYMLGGNWRAIIGSYLLDTGQERGIHGFEIERADMIAHAKMLMRAETYTPERLSEEFGERADKIPAAARVLIQTLEHLQPAYVVGASCTLRDGVLAEKLAGLCATA